MLHTLAIIDDNPIFYDEELDILSYKDNKCLLVDLLYAVREPVDRIKIPNTDLLLKKHDLDYSIGCLRISIENFNRYKKIIKQLKNKKNVTN